MLKGIELTGFKSFAKKTALGFTAPITAVVGPNGSGKSNVAEAFRFVLGEQSIKSLRGKRVEDLIFNGGKDAARVNRASVKIIFDNSRRVFNLDFDEVSFERIIHRDSVSEYFINGSVARLKDIIELLAAAHIGASGHHIISQGEADKILNANLRDRRKIIEEALGLKIYQYKKEDSVKKLEKTEDNIKQVESLRREIAPHLRFLKKQVEKIEKTLELKEQLKVLYREYFKREDEYLKKEKALLVEEKRHPLAELTRLDQALKQAKEILEKSKTKDEKSGAIMSLELELREVRSVKDTLMRDFGRLEGEINLLERQLKKQEISSAAVKVGQIDYGPVEQLVKSIIEQTERGVVAESLNAIRDIFQHIKTVACDFLTRNQTILGSESRSDLKKDIEDLKVRKVALEERILQQKEDENNLLLRSENLRQEIEREKDSNREAEKEVFRIMAEQNDINAKLALLENREERYRLDENNYKQELTEAGVLIGLDALRFRDLNLTITDEDRTVQGERRKAIEKIKIRIEDTGLGSSDDVLKEYREASERDAFLDKELIDLKHSSEALSVLIKELDEKLMTEFKNGVDKINAQFQEFFHRMFGGGTAKLVVIKEKKRKLSETDELANILNSDISPVVVEEGEAEDGIDIEVSLPKKKIKGLMMLSGGERALTSIALLFAMSQVNPPPFIILDETDAALDEANSKKYGDMIENLSQYSQLVLVTHNRETMSRAGVIYGVTMGADGTSHLLSIQFDEAVRVAK